MSSLTISIEHKDSYDLATELVLALQESRAVVIPVNSPETDDFRTTLNLPGLERDAEDKIIREAMNWANSKGLEPTPTMRAQDSDVDYLTIH